jgi:hypothetical protein
MLEQQSDKSTDQSSGQSQREELESLRQESDDILYLEGNDTAVCIGLVGQGNVSDLDLDVDDYGAYQDQFCTSNVELWDHWPLTELNSVA